MTTPGRLVVADSRDVHTRVEAAFVSVSERLCVCANLIDSRAARCGLY